MSKRRLKTKKCVLRRGGLVNFNGIHVENYFENKYEKGFFMVNDIRGRGILSDEIYELSVPRRAGSYYLGKRTPRE